MFFKHTLEAIPKLFGYRLVKKNYVSRKEIPEPRPELDEVPPKIKKEFVPHQKRERQGTSDYKNGSMYLYCTPEDKKIAHRLAIEKGCSMKELLHQMLAVADVNKTKIHADPNPVIPADQIRTMKASEFFEEFLLGPMERYEQKKAGDKK